MRPTTSLLVGVLFILSIASCADVSQYLKSGESVSKEETFTVDSSVYTLIYIGGEPALLLDGNGNIITNSVEIARVLMKHFSDLYYPSPTEIAALRSDFEAYDASRNNGDMYKNVSLKLPGMNESVGVEEEVCKYSLFLNTFPCTNSSNCIYSAMMLCDEFGDAIGCNDPRDLLPHVEKFSFANIGMENDMGRIYYLLDGLTPTNIYASLTEIKTIMQRLDDYENDLEGTKFRQPERSEKCTDCMGLCPKIIINETYLASAEGKIDAMLAKTTLLGDYESKGARMAEGANERVKMARDNAERAALHSAYDPVRERSVGVVASARNLLQVVSNSTVAAYADRIDALVAKIDSDLEKGDFTDVNASLEELRAKTSALEGAIPSQWKIYNDTEKAKAEASLSLFILQTSSLNEEQAAFAASLSARKGALDRGFVSGLTPERYLEITASYNNITESAAPLVQQVEQGSAYLSPFMAAGRRTNEGLESLAVTISPMDREEKGRLAEYAPILLSSISFFSLSSLLTFAFLFAFASMNSRARKRSTMFVGFAVLGIGLLAVGIVSAGVYVTAKSSSTDSDFNEFRSTLAGVDHASVIIEEEGVSAGAVADMKRCAGEIASALAPRSVAIYEKTNGDCATGSGVLGECYNNVDEPIIMLRYSTTQERPEFSAVFVDSATFYGDEQFFRGCEFAKMLAVDMQQGEPDSGGETQNGSSEWVME